MSDETLPKNWVYCTFADVGSIVSGGTPSTLNPDFGGDEARWIGPADLTGYKSKFIARGAKSLSNAGFENCSAKLMPAGSVHFSSRAPVEVLLFVGHQGDRDILRDVIRAVAGFDEFAVADDGV